MSQQQPRIHAGQTACAALREVERRQWPQFVAVMAASATVRGSGGAVVIQYQMLLDISMIADAIFTLLRHAAMLYVSPCCCRRFAFDG